VPGATPHHLRLASNLHTEVAVALRETDCFVYTSDLRVWIERGSLYTYPDLTVACGEEQMKEGETMGTLLNPTLVAEVLSPSTEGYDRGAKFALYQTLPSLRTYVLVAQDRRRVEVFDRLDAPNRWELRTYGPDDATVALPTLDAEIDLDALYARVDLGAA
jgi:Uma2 family endonuclease